MGTSIILPESVLHQGHPISRLETSNLPAKDKSAIRAYWDGLHDRLGAMSKRQESTGETAVREGMELVRQDAVAGVTGMAVAYLEHVAGGSLDWKGIPLDLAASIATGIGSLASHSIGVGGLSPDFRTVSSTALGIFAYRKGKEKWSGKVSPLAARGDSLEEFANRL